MGGRVSGEEEESVRATSTQTTSVRGGARARDMRGGETDRQKKRRREMFASVHNQAAGLKRDVLCVGVL
jgi:hypothetical protein